MNDHAMAYRFELGYNVLLIYNLILSEIMPGSFTRFVVNYQADERRQEGIEVRKKDRLTDVDVTDLVTDEDGDLILTRKQKTKNVITIGKQS